MSDNARPFTIQSRPQLRMGYSVKYETQAHNPCLLLYLNYWTFTGLLTHTCYIGLSLGSFTFNLIKSKPYLANPHVQSKNFTYKNFLATFLTNIHIKNYIMYPRIRIRIRIWIPIRTSSIFRYEVPDPWIFTRTHYPHSSPCNLLK